MKQTKSWRVVESNIWFWRFRNTIPQGLPALRAPGLRQDVSDNGTCWRDQVQFVRVKLERLENVRRPAHSIDGRIAVQVVCAPGRHRCNVRQQGRKNGHR